MPRLVFALAEVGTQRGGLAREPVGFGRRLCALCARGFWGLLPSHTGQHRRGIAAVQARLALPALRCPPCVARLALRGSRWLYPRPRALL
jgi:hypothetical protein